MNDVCGCYCLVCRAFIIFDSSSDFTDIFVLSTFRLYFYRSSLFKMSQPCRSNRSISDNDLEHGARECVRFFINKSVTKAPIKRADLLKYLNKIREGLSKNINEILNVASQKLKEVYGFKLVELNSKTHYILILDEADTQQKVESSSKYLNLLLISALSHIFMSGGSVREDGMWRFLEKAGLLKDGDTVTQKIYTHQFTKELYLNYVKTGELDNPKYLFEWGPRAKAELPKMFLLKKIADAFNRPTDYWCEQNTDALESEQNITNVE